MRWLSACVAFVLLGLLSVQAADDKKGDNKGIARFPLFVDNEKKQITIDCKIAPRKIDDPAFKEIYPIEVIACWPFSKDPGKGGQKAHETVVTFENTVMPSMVHKGLEILGLKAGKPIMGGGKADVPQGPEVVILLEFAGPDGQPKRVPIERTLVDSRTKKSMPKLKWRFTGSAMKQPDPNKPDKVYGADLTGTLISIFPVTDQTVFQTHLTMAEEKFIKLDTDKNLLPKEGTPAKLIIQVSSGK